MKLEIKQDLTCSDMEVTIKYVKEDSRLKRILAFLQAVDIQIKGVFEK